MQQDDVTHEQLLLGAFRQSSASGINYYFSAKKKLIIQKYFQLQYEIHIIYKSY